MVELRGQRVLVVGLGASGVAAARFLARRGARVIGNDARERAALGEVAEALEAEGVTLALGGHDEMLFTSVDRVVVSPGVPLLPAIAAAENAGVPVMSEIELASRFLRGTMIAITGTNGKSTVTTLIGEMCKATGRATFIGGNLGTPLLEAVDDAADDGYVVVEVSSFQLERTSSFRPHVAVLLNVTDDHLDRHGTLAEYAAAKGRIFSAQTRADHAVVPSGDELVTSLARACAGKIHFFGGEDGEVRVAGDLIARGDRVLLRTDELRIRGGHNVTNACAAALSAHLAGVPDDAIAGTLRSFTGLPHRMVLVAVKDGVTYYDDSKATNVGASVAAIDGLGDFGGRVVLIAGGKDKGGSYAPLRDRMDAVGRAAVLIGEATPLLERAFEGAKFAVERGGDIDDAVSRAKRLARPGDVVLLAPACASFDMFRSYAHRGDEFQRAVRALGEGT